MRRICMALVLTITLLSVITVCMAEANPQTASAPEALVKTDVVRVGIVDSIYFSEKQEDGSYKGLMIDYLTEISKYTGWKLEFVEGSSDEMIDKLENGEVDLMGTMLKNEATLQRYEFAEYTSGYSYTTLRSLKEDDRYRPMDYSSFNGMRVGLYSKALNRIPAFLAFVESNGLNMTPVYYDDYAAYEQALEKGEVDAVLGNDTSGGENYKTIAKFNAVPYYFAVPKGRSDLLRKLNAALATIIEVNPKFDDMVYEKHINSRNLDFALSKAEEAFVRKADTLKVAMVSDLAPLEYYDRSKNRFEGVSPDVLALISEKTGLEFEFVPAGTLQEAKDKLLAGEVDLISGIYDNAVDRNELGIVFTRRYLDSQMIIVKNASPNENAQGVAAMPLGYSADGIADFSEVQFFDSMEDCVQAVISGGAELTVFNNFVIDQYTYLRGNRHVSLTPATNISDGLSFGLARPADPALLSILDKAIYSIPADIIQAIVYENTTAEAMELTLTSMLYSYPTVFAAVVGGIAIILLVAAILLLLFVHTRLKLARQSAMSGESYRIIGELTEEYIFSYDFDTEELVLPDAFSQLVGRKNQLFLKKVDLKNDDLVKSLCATFDTEGSVAGAAVEFQCKQTDGKKVWFRAVGTVQFDSEGEPVRGLGKIVSIQDEKQEKQRLEYMVNTDSLTELFNRQYCEQYIMDYFKQEQDRRRGALLIIDLDNFKQVNDTLGHLAGDIVLQELAQALNDTFGGEDIVGRWGGDEFIAFVRDVPDTETLSARAHRLCVLMNKEFTYEGTSCMLSVSIGIALAENAATYAHLFQSADAALYEVKKNQRNGFRFG